MVTTCLTALDTRVQHSDITITVSEGAGPEDEKTFYLHKFPVR